MLRHFSPLLFLPFLQVSLALDTWLIPYPRRAVPIPGHTVSAPLSSCQDNFNTEDKDQCFTIDHDQRSGVVNVTVNCCIWNELMFKKETMIKANAYRCEVLVCDQKQSGSGVEINSLHPVFTEGKQMTGCCLRDGVMYKPGARFYDEATDSTLVCCSGDILAALPEPTAEPVVEEPVKIQCPSYRCGAEDNFVCKNGRKVDKLDLQRTEYALFPSLIHQEGFSMHMYGGRESLKRDCHGHYFFSSNVKLTQDREDLSVKFLGLDRQHHLQGFLLKFTPGFRQAWAKMLDVEGGFNPLVKDIALDSSGFIFALLTYEKEDDSKEIRVQKYDQCGEFVAGFDIRPGTFISREAYLTIDSNDDVIAFHSYSDNREGEDSSINPCHIAKVSGSGMDRILWEDTIDIMDGQSSCMPTGIKTDCDDNMYVTGFMASNRGFVRKYSASGEVLWTESNMLDQVTEVIYDPLEDTVVVTIGTERILLLDNHGQELKSIELKAREIALGDEGYFAFHFQDNEHKIGYLTKDLQLQKNYDISWENWNSISWCDNLVPNVYGTEVFLTCSLHDAQDVIIFQTKLGDKKTFLGARAET